MLIQCPLNFSLHFISFDKSKEWLCLQKFRKKLFKQPGFQLLSEKKVFLCRAAGIDNKWAK